MVIDSSALLAILNDEPQRSVFNQAIEKAVRRLISAASFVEASMVLQARRGDVGVHDLDMHLITAGIQIVPVDEDQARLARDAFRRYGKGRHPAGLNFGDCFSYALAQTTGLPLLFKGRDFSQTDLESAV